MRKSVLFLSMAVLAGTTATARSLDPSEALERALGQHSGAVSRSMSGTPELVMTIGSDESPALYVFNQPERGYMIVSADDVAAPVIGYSDNGRFDPDNLPENFRYWLEQCKVQIQAASASGFESYSRSETVTREPIAPLMSTIWDQNAPYNDLCPKLDGVSTFTGCVATAMAEVMKYHNWPDKVSENANITYQWYTGETVTLSEDFSNFEFDWANMIDDYSVKSTPEQAAAVAKLMQACGYSVNMHYGTSSSGAHAPVVGNALVEYFKYDAGLHNEPRELHSTVEWENMVYENLKTCGPVIYWGSGSGSHCFVCDGYRGNGYYHFNWGWSGLSDGWFLLDMLNPGATGIGGSSGGFNNAQGALFGIKPASPGVSTERRYTLYSSEGISNVFLSGSSLEMFGEFMNFSPFKIKGNYVFRVYSDDGKYLMSLPLEMPASPSELYTLNYETMLKGDIPASLPDGTYHIYPAFAMNGEEYTFQVPGGSADYVIYTRENGKDTASLHESGTISIESLSTNGEIYLGKRFRITGIAKLSGEGETKRPVAIRLLANDGSVCGYGSNFMISFSWEGTPIDLVCDWFSPAGSVIEAGDYTLAIEDETKTIATCPVTVTDKAASGEYEVVEVVVENASGVDPSNINITATVKGISGVVDENITFIISRGITPVSTKRVPLFVAAGQTVTVNLNTSLISAIPGYSYSVTCGKNEGGKWIGKTAKAYFYIGDTSGIADIEADDNAPVEYFNLSGVRVDDTNLTPGIYVRRQGSKVSKIILK